MSSLASPLLARTTDTNVSRWRPNQGPQEYVLRLPPIIAEILYGGMRGGGKTDAGIVWVGNRRWRDAAGNLHPVYEHPRYHALVIRKNADDLSDWIERFRHMYQGTGCKVGYQPAVIRFPSGAMIRTGHLKDDQAYTKYQGHEYQSILIEELTQIPTIKRYMQLLSSLRSTVPELRPQFFGTTNPGGVGHAWVKHRWIDPSPPLTPIRPTDGGRMRMFVPGGIEDNPALLNNDPGYVQHLEEIKHIDYELYKAWRLGRWDVFAGQAFREWNPLVHILHSKNRMDFGLDICKKIITFDWGYRDKAAAHWLALTPPNSRGVRRVYVYREIIRTQTDPEEWAQIIKRFTDAEKVDYMVLPHDCFAHKLSHSTIADTFNQILTGLSVRRGDTMAKGARLNRKAMLHLYLSNAIDGRPHLMVDQSCKDFIETVPMLQYDERNIEDIDTTQDDHSYDSVTLGLVSLPYRPKAPTLYIPTRQLQTLPTWNTQENGEIQAPNFWRAFKDRQELVPHDIEFKR